jgi:hypothetical protein
MNIETEHCPDARLAFEPFVRRFEVSMANSNTSFIILPTGEKVVFDKDDEEKVLSYAWHNNGKGYACAKTRSEGSRVTIQFHRLVMGFPASEIDHINRDRLDNRKENLRECTRSDNIKNTAKRNNTTSKYRGVSTRKGKYQVVVRIDGKLKWVGQYDNEDEAGRIAASYFSGVSE